MFHRSLLAVAALCGLLPTLSFADDAAQAIQPAEPALGREVDFSMDVFPMLQAKCIACHNRKTAESDLVLESVEAIMKGCGSGVVVVAGKPDESLLYKAAARSEEPHMPPLPNTVAAKALTPQELGLLKKWIEEGAKPGMSGSGDGGLAWQAIPDSVTAVFSLALDPRERFLAAGRVNRIAVYDLISKREVAQLSDPALSAIQLDGTPMYPAGAAHRDFVHALAFSPDGQLLASSGYREIKLWERQRNIQLQKLAADAAVTALAVSADGTQGATGLANGSVILWNLATGARGAVLAGHTAAVNGLAFNADGSLLVSGSEDASVRTWKAADGMAVASLTTPAPVRALVLNTDGSQVVTGHGDNLIRVWQLPQPDVTAAPIREIPGHGGPVNALALLGATNEVLSGSDDASIRIWKLDTGEQTFTQSLTGPVTSVAVSPDAQFVAGGDAAGIARVFNRAANQQVAEVKGNPDLEYASVQATDNQTVAKDQQALADAALKEADKDVTSRDESLKKANEQKTAADKTLAEAEPKVVAAQQALDAAAKELEGKPEDEALKKKKTDAETALKTETEARDKAKDGVASAERAIKLSQEALTASQQRQAQAKTVLEAAVQAVTAADQAAAAATQAATGARPAVRGVAFSKDGTQLITGSDDGIVRVWLAASGKPLDVLQGHSGAVADVAALADGSVWSAGADSAAIVWETRPQWKLVARIGPGAENPLDVSASPLVDRVLCLDFSPDGTKLACGGGEPSRSGQLQIWDVANRSLIRELTDAHSDTVFDVEFSRDGKTLISGAADKFVKTFDVETGKFIRGYEGHTGHVLGVSIKADGSTIASSGADNAVKLWNTATGEQIRTISGFNKQVTDVDYVGVLDLVVTCGGDPQTRCYNAANGTPKKQFDGSKDFVYSVVASRDEGIIASAGEDGVIRVWNGTSGELLATFEPTAPAAQTAAVQ